MSVAAAIGAVEARRLATNPAIWVSVVPALLWAVYAGDDALGEHFLLSGYGIMAFSALQLAVYERFDGAL